MDRIKEIENYLEEIEKGLQDEVPHQELIMNILAQPLDYIEYLLDEVKRLKWKIESNRIGSHYSGSSQGYHIELNGEEVHYTKDAYQRDMFIAELKARINIALREDEMNG